MCDIVRLDYAMEQVLYVGGEANSPLHFPFIGTCLNSSIISTNSRFAEGRENHMDVDAVTQLIGNFGFPIVVSAYLLIRIEGKLGDLTSSITELAKVVAALKG